MDFTAKLHTVSDSVNPMTKCCSIAWTFFFSPPKDKRYGLLGKFRSMNNGFKTKEQSRSNIQTKTIKRVQARLEAISS